MASSERTEHYMLNLWSGTDKHTRSDFVRDNQLIDTALWQHAANIYAHLTNDEKDRVQEPFVFRVVQGTDSATRNVNFDFSPRIVVCFAIDEPLVEYDQSSTIVNSAMAVSGMGSSKGCALGNNVFVMNQNTNGNVVCNLNNSANQYLIIAVK